MGVLGLAYQDYSHTNNRHHTGTVRMVKRQNWKPILERSESDEENDHQHPEWNQNQEISSNGSAKPNITNTGVGGWIRVFCGPDRSELITIEPSRMVHCDLATTTEQIIKNLDLPPEFTLWLQIGGSSARRLHESEQPFQIQEDFFKELGYIENSRRSRLEIDPEIKYLIRFYIGPAEIVACKGVTKTGLVDVLKGLVFPQWKKRGMAVIGNHLFLFPANNYMNPEVFALSGAEIIEHGPGYERLILKIVPKVLCDNSNFYLKDNNKLSYKSLEMLSSTSASSVYNSSGSINSTGTGDREKVLFLGFEESWERDLWSAWLVEGTTEASESRRLDIGNSGLQTIPEVVLHSLDDVEELLAGQNKLQEIGLKALAQFPQLQILRLPGNSFRTFPIPLLHLAGLTVLDLADNLIDRIPDEIAKLELLQELRVDRNGITELPNSLRSLRHLRSLQAANNRISRLPPFLVKMRTMGLVDMYAQKTDPTILNNLHSMQDRSKSNYSNPPLNKVSLRANQLRGNIILGNYGNLTQLDVSENEIEILDLSALGQLESLQCCRNKLVELTVNGGALTSLIAGNNDLRKLSIMPVPAHLRHLDVGFNNLSELPEWLSGCHQLRTLFANNNRLRTLPEHLFCSELNTLHTLQLGYNKLTCLPAMPRRRLPLQELFLQCNEIDELPENFFYACENLVLLNISSNKLFTLPPVETEHSQLERLYATKNCWTDRVLRSLVGFRNIRVLHAAYNRLTTFPQECIQNWPELEELILSGNRLQHLPENLANLAHLKVLRVHSNQLQSTPPLSKTTTLRVLDLAHNQLDKINLVNLVPKKLQFLDLSCNLQLQVDPRQLQVCRSQRPMSLVDVSGKNRSSLPSTPDAYQENADIEPPWKVGFSETAGSSSKLYIAQLRLPNFCNTEGLFGMFDGEINSTVPSLLVKVIPKILLEERTVKETAREYMKYTILSAHRELRQNGQKHGVCATLCHISRQKISHDYSATNAQGRKFVLRIASVGEATVYLVRKTGCVRLTPATPRRQIGNSACFPLVIPDPEVSELVLGEQDEYLVMANKKLWEIVDIEIVAREIRIEENVILAAKRVQDIAQSFGAEENLSVVIVKFNSLGTDVDYLIRELRQTVRKKSGSILSGFCKCGCCCESNNSCCHSAASTQFVRTLSARSDRSSPSGQSDQAASELTVTKPKLESVSSLTSRKSTGHIANERRSLKGSVARAVRAKIEEERERELDETDSALSEEQYKCWEYMLEQNTQLLFDKELNTISKAFTKNEGPTKTAINNLNLLSNSSNLVRTTNNKLLSASTPQLGYNENQQGVSSNQNSFLSKHFGSARSFHPPAPPGLFKSLRFNSGRMQPIGGGPNAAYFGSLQRLMPYNLEYDFAVMQERGVSQDDTLEHEGRMRQYWGVATTEL